MEISSREALELAARAGLMESAMITWYYDLDNSIADQADIYVQSITPFLRGAQTTSRTAAAAGSFENKAITCSDSYETMSPSRPDGSSYTGYAENACEDVWRVIATFLPNRDLIRLAGTCTRLRKKVKSIIPSRVASYGGNYQGSVALGMLAAHVNIAPPTYWKYTIHCEMCGELRSSTNQIKVHILHAARNSIHCGRQCKTLLTPMKTNDVCRWIVYSDSHFGDSIPNTILTQIITQGTSADLNDVQIDTVLRVSCHFDGIKPHLQTWCDTVAKRALESESADIVEEVSRMLPTHALTACKLLLLRHIFVKEIKTHGVDTVTRFAIYTRFMRECAKINK